MTFALSSLRKVSYILQVSRFSPHMPISQGDSVAFLMAYRKNPENVTRESISLNNSINEVKWDDRLFVTFNRECMITWQTNTHTHTHTLSLSLSLSNIYRERVAYHTLPMRPIMAKPSVRVYKEKQSASNTNYSMSSAN